LKKLYPFVIAVSLVLGGTAIPTLAADNTLKVSNPPAEFIIGEPGKPDPELTVIVIVTGPVRANINLEFVDYVFDDQGYKTRLPANTTPHSLAKVFQVEPFDNAYKPSASGSEFTIKLKPKQKKIDQIFYGGIKVTMDSDSSSNANQRGTGSANSSGAIASQVNVTPYGFVGDIKNGKITGAQLARVNFTSTNRTSIIDSIIPDLPGLVNAGPIEAKVAYENKGELPVFTSASWEFSSEDKVLASKRSSKTILLGGRSATRSVITQSKIEGSQETINVLPDFGSVKIKTTLQSELGGTMFEPVVVESSIFVIQWKEPTFFVALAIAFGWYYRRRRVAPKTSKQRPPSLLVLAIKAMRKAVIRRLALRKSKEVA
jgi:hypothetical protein